MCDRTASSLLFIHFVLHVQFGHSPLHAQARSQQHFIACSGMHWHYLLSKNISCDELWLGWRTKNNSCDLVWVCVFESNVVPFDVITPRCGVHNVNQPWNQSCACIVCFSALINFSQVLSVVSVWCVFVGCVVVWEGYGLGMFCWCIMNCWAMLQLV